MTNHVERLTAAIAGRYTVEREIGRGGMATVYLAHDVRHQRKVAVKVLYPELALAVGPARFLREIEVAARLNHPHILSLHDSGEADGMLYYVMPFVEGESLQERLRREGQLAIDDALRIAREVADALAYAHGHGVLHRDVKPANIMLESNHALVADFGVALIAHAGDAERLTGSRLSPGTPLYMSPEQASGELQVDGRTDIYSLGCVLYEMLSGDPPFVASSQQAIIAKKLVEPVPSLRVVRDTVTPTLELVVMKALARTPADRFRSAAELTEALEAAAFEHIAGRRLTPPFTPRWDHAPAPADTAPRTTLSGQPGTATLAKALAVGAVTVALLTAIGFVTTIVYDVALDLPVQFTPSRADFPLIGVRAVTPAVIIGFALLVVFFMAIYLVRLLGFGLRRMRVVRALSDAVQQRFARRWHTLWSTARPPAVADLYFIATIGVSIVTLLLFWRQLPASARSAPPANLEVLSCEFRDLHNAYTAIMVVLTMVLASAWWVTFRYLAARAAVAGRVALIRWASLAWILTLVVLTTAPWRLLWTREQRALLNGDRVYILLERGEDVVLYNASQDITQHYRTTEMSQLQRLNTNGYRFESERAFGSSNAGC